MSVCVCVYVCVCVCVCFSIFFYLSDIDIYQNRFTVKQISEPFVFVKWCTFDIIQQVDTSLLLISHTDVNTSWFK